MVSRHFRPEVRVLPGFGAGAGGCGGACSLVPEGRFPLGSGGRGPGPRGDAGLSPPPALAEPRDGGRPLLAARDLSDGSPPRHGDLGRGGRGRWADAGPPGVRVFSENPEPQPPRRGKKAGDDGCLLLPAMRTSGDRTSGTSAMRGSRRAELPEGGGRCEDLISFPSAWFSRLRCHCWCRACPGCWVESLATSCVSAACTSPFCMAVNKWVRLQGDVTPCVFCASDVCLRRLCF